MSKLHVVTITGADDKVRHEDMVALSEEFPFVEWGILSSQSRMGTPRYPSREWIEELPDSLRTSCHVCGVWSREILDGNRGLEPYKLYNRFQINGFAAERASDAFLKSARLQGGQLILPVRSNAGADYSNTLTIAKKVGASVLYDPSGGRGVGPEDWEKAPLPVGVRMGYAGGISPDNVVEVIEKLDRKPHEAPGYWIDMESGVRSDKDALDLDKVHRVLALAAPYCEAHAS